jgi:hypothetical protein
MILRSEAADHLFNSIQSFLRYRLTIAVGACSSNFKTPLAQVRQNRLGKKESVKDPYETA